MSPSTVEYYDRTKKLVISEEVYAGGFIDFCYGKVIGKLLLKGVFSQKWANDIYYSYKASRFSTGQIATDCEQFGVSMDEFPEEQYRSYREFFLRRFRPGVRTFVDGQAFPAFAEGRYFAFRQIEDSICYPVKGCFLRAQDLVGPRLNLDSFDPGAMFIARLCPIDYHYFHFPDDGSIIERFTVPGAYYPVSIKGITKKQDTFLSNIRQINLLKTQYFGRLIYIEVGAMCVGRIHETHPNERRFQRGDEKGYFDFGGSTVIVICEKGLVTPSEDILEQTAQGRETLIKLGEEIGHKVRIGS